MKLLDELAIHGNVIGIWGEEYTGGLRVTVNGQSHTLPRGNAQLLVENLTRFLEITEACPECHHARIEHFKLWTQPGSLVGCSHGITADYKLAAGLPCDCSGASAL